MSHRPTPETNSAFKFWPCEQMELVHAEFARKLEHERDEAREQLSAVKHFLHKYIAERDEAREIIADSLKALPVGYIPTHTPDSVPERIADLVATIVERDRERDKAREQERIHYDNYITMKKERDEWSAMCGRYKQERDEARKVLREIEATRALERKI